MSQDLLWMLYFYFKYDFRRNLEHFGFSTVGLKNQRQNIKRTSLSFPTKRLTNLLKKYIILKTKHNVNRQAQKTQDSTLLERAKPKLDLHFLELTQVFGARGIRRRAINARLIQILFYLSELNVWRISDARTVRFFISSITNQLCIPHAEVFKSSLPLRKYGYRGP